jgi:hypothetical protein
LLPDVERGEASIAAVSKGILRAASAPGTGPRACVQNGNSYRVRPSTLCDAAARDYSAQAAAQ